MPRWGNGISECLSRGLSAEMGAGIGEYFPKDGVPRWRAGIGECLSKGRSAEMEE